VVHRHPGPVPTRVYLSDAASGACACGKVIVAAGEVSCQMSRRGVRRTLRALGLSGGLVRGWRLAVVGIVVLLSAVSGVVALTARDHDHGERVTGPRGAFPGSTADEPPEAPSRLLARFDGDWTVVGGLRLSRRWGRITARALRTGAEYWTYTRQGRKAVASSVTSRDVYVLWDDGQLVRFDLRRVASHWHSKVGRAPALAGAQNTPAVRLVEPDEGVVAIVTAGAADGFATSNGARRWTTSAPAGCKFSRYSSSGQVISVAGTLVVLGECEASASKQVSDLFGIDGGHGGIRWHRTVPLARSLARVDDQRVGVAQFRGGATVVDSRDGGDVQTFGNPPRHGQLLLADAGGGEVLFTTPPRDEVSAWDATTGRRLWGLPPDPVLGNVETGVYAATGRVYAVATRRPHGTARFTLLVVDARSGRRLHTQPLRSFFDPAALQRPGTELRVTQVVDGVAVITMTAPPAATGNPAVVLTDE
jgi:outer membrane protein assembly factor BamB